ncbi:MAG: beta-ketoacyl synthase chain length factor [Pseudomonadota bacterium]
MMRVTVESIGLTAPGMAGWEAAVPVLRGALPLNAADLPPFKPNLLPPNERRRTTALIKLALQTAEDALARSHYAMNELASVFASSEGDGEIVDRICTALNLPGQPVSPIHFHNSVHNAPAGYWAIAAGSRRFSSSLAAGADTFAAGLLEAAGVAVLERMPVLFLAYDYPLPPALAGRGYVDTVFATAMVLTADDGPGMAQLELSLREGSALPPLLGAELDALRVHNPAAAALPLLQVLARGDSGNLALPCQEHLVLHIGVSA